MSFSTEWDIEKYRVGYESDEHWELRKKFLLQHKNEYPEDKLVCLAQVFYNVEFLGCRYPKDTMKVVAKLSRGIVEDHREKMKKRLKRTFVGASDAASSKVKGLNQYTAAAGYSHLMQSKTIQFEPQSEGPVLNKKDTLNPLALSSVSAELKQAKEAKQASLPTPLCNKPIVCPKKKKNKKKGSEAVMPLIATPESPDLPDVSSPASSFVSTSSKFHDVVLYFREEDNPGGKIQSSCAFSRVPFKMSSTLLEKSSLHQSAVLVCGVEVGSGTGDTAALAQESAARAAVNYLSKQCYTIMVKKTFVAGREVQKHEIMDCPPSNKVKAVSDNRASLMMKKMGWSGGGLGKEEQGRTEPIMPVHQSRRAGVGSTDRKIKFKNLKDIFQDFIKSGSTHDIVFSTDFDNLERKEIHTVAHRFGLKSQSRSKGENRFLVVSRKWTPKVLLSILRDKKNDSEKFLLIPPNSSGCCTSSGSSLTALE